jgi:uncharacterized protein with FMN-binding domain
MTPERPSPSRRAVPAIALTAAGLTALLRLQGVIGAAPAPAPDGSPLAAAARAPAEGAVPGQPVTTRYGPVQVAAVVRGGKLAEVQTLQRPGASDPTSRQINDRAIPVLNQEAVAAQSARIDSVAGATFTSEGYRQSLQSAIDAAGTGPAAGSPTSAPAPRATGPANGGGATTAPTRPTPTTGPSPTPAPAPPTTAEPPPVTRTVLADGQPVNIPTGAVQVQATVSGDRITDVRVLTYPAWNPVSAGLNAAALPKLRDQAMAAQSARAITAVTGATYTSNAYRQSLQSALDSAGYTG